MLKRSLNTILSLCFVIVSVVPNAACAQAVSPAYTPAFLSGMVIDAKNPFAFDFIIDPGDVQLSDTLKKQEYTRLAKYFLASLTVPDTDQWVNLSPYEHNRIIADNFGKTEMGRDLLEQDQVLKQVTSSLSNPDSALGQKFWSEVYARAHQKYTDTTIPTDVFNKVWITPDSVKLYEKGNVVYVLSQHLKVQLEADHVAGSAAAVSTVEHASGSKVSQEVMREVILPVLDKEVNSGKNFARLRQVYSGMILAAWYKQALKGSLLTKMYGDQSKVIGVNQDPANNEVIYAQYMAAFKKGAYNLIREEQDQNTTEVIPRKYFSGGMKDASQAVTAALAAKVSVLTLDQAQAIITSDMVRIDLKAVDAAQILPKIFSDLFKTVVPTYGLGGVEEWKKEIVRSLNAWRDKEPRIPAAFPLGDEVFNHVVEQLAKQLYADEYLQNTLDYIRITPGGRLIVVRGRLYIDLYPVDENGKIGSRMRRSISGFRDPKILLQGNAVVFYFEPGKQIGGFSLVEVEKGELKVSGYRLKLKRDESTAKFSSFDLENDGSITVNVENERTRKSVDQKVFQLDLSEGKFVPVTNYYVDIQPTDAAQGVMPMVEQAVNGGIDLARTNLDMQIKRDVEGMPLPLARQDLKHFQIDGLIPVVLDIRKVGEKINPRILGVEGYGG